MQVWQLHGIGDQLDLCIQAADVLIGDIRHFFEQQIVDFGPWQALEHDVGSNIEQQVVARSQRLIPQISGEFHDSFLVGAACDQGPEPVFEHLIEGHHLARGVGTARQHDVVGLVEHDFAALNELRFGEVRVQGDAHLAAAGVHICRAVVVAGQERSICRGRLGQLVHFFSQRGDVLSRLTQRVGQLLVLRHRCGQLPLGLEQALFERADSCGGVSQLAPKQSDLFFECAHATAERACIGRIAALGLIVALVHARLTLP